MSEPVSSTLPIFYPVNDFGPAMKGMVIGGVGIFHVFVAQFAIGGGMLLTYFEWLHQRGREPLARASLDRLLNEILKGLAHGGGLDEVGPAL